MIKPPIDTLIDGIANALEETVLPEVGGERARRQLKDGLRVLRRLAKIWDEVLPTIQQENLDIETTLARLSSELDALGALPDRWRDLLEPSGVAEGDALSARTLSARNERLQELLAEVHGRLAECEAGDSRRAAEEGLRALYQRSLARDRTLSGR